MSLIVGLITVLLISFVLRQMGTHPDDVGCLTIIVLLIGLPFLSTVGNFVMKLF